MKNSLLILLISNLFLFSCISDKNKHDIKLKSSFFQISINDKGAISQFVDIKSNKDYCSKDSISYLMSIRINNKIIPPQSAELKGDTVYLGYVGDIEAQIKVEQKKTHISFDLLSITQNDIIELIIWGPYATTIDQIIGETVGVVQGEEYAIGIQSLNIKTLGGYPWQESDCMPEFDIFEQEDASDMSSEGKRQVLYRIEAAKPTLTGSSLQAYCRNRNKDRIVENLKHQHFVAPKYNDGGIIDSKMALFGCQVLDVLETIGTIEIEENLPHPTIDGQWGKIASGASAAYIIMDFNEKNIDEAIKITKKAGLRYLYHYGRTFKSWGHFELSDDFPNGYEGMKNCVEKAKEQGVMLGIHTLSNFIQTNDAYVTPIPDKRLAQVGSSVLSADIDKNQIEISIASPIFFNQFKNNSLKTVMIDEELIRYSKVSAESPWKLLDCQRGAFNTKISSHQSGEKISKLIDHPYKVFLSNADLTIELSNNIAELYNQTGLRQISFDGLEGNRSTGMGSYGETLMPYTWYNSLNDELKEHLIIDASRTTHFFWHIYSRMNWGEPWYAGFRESQTAYRLKNQKYFKRNLMPAMLGWFQMTDETSIEDIEWLLARSAAFNAGYAFVINKENVIKNGNSDKIFQLIGEWEKVRMAGLFTPEQKQRMEDVNNEFSLEIVGENEWNLYEVYSGKFKHEKKIRQPGEPLYSTFEFENIGEEQSIGFIIAALDSDISAIKMEIDQYKEIILPITLKQGQHIKYSGGKEAFVYDRNWNLIKPFEVNASDFIVSEGNHSLTLDAHFSNTDKDTQLKIEIRTFGRAERINN